MTISDPVGNGNICYTGRAFYESTINYIFLYTKRLVMLLLYIEDRLVACHFCCPLVIPVMKADQTDSLCWWEWCRTVRVWRVDEAKDLKLVNICFIQPGCNYKTCWSDYIFRSLECIHLCPIQCFKYLMLFKAEGLAWLW